jgi:hypothetical protein
VPGISWYEANACAILAGGSLPTVPHWRAAAVLGLNSEIGALNEPNYQAAPPYQAVVYFPHSGGFVLDSFQQAEMAYLGFLVKA